MDSFQQYLLDHGIKRSTIYRHTANLKRLSNHCPNLTKAEISSYFEQLAKQGLKNTYLNTMICTLRQYGRFMDNPELLTFKILKKQEFIKATMSDEEIEQFLYMKNPFSSKPYWCKKTHRYIEPILYSEWEKYTLFWEIMAFTGMRPGEIAALKVEDVDFGRQIFIIEDTKTNKPAVSPIPTNILNKIKSFVSQSEGKYLFPSKFGGSSKTGLPVLSNVDWHYNFHRRIKIMGLKRKNLTPYSLRHSFATRLLETEGVNLFHVKKLMHHNDLKSTLVYEHLTTHDLIRAVEKLPLVRRGTAPQNILENMAEIIKAFKIYQDKRFDYCLEERGNLLKFEVKIKNS